MRSNYHIVRYVLDVGYHDHVVVSQGMDDWRSWMQTVCRMFPKKQPPKSLLAGLRSKGNPHVSLLCDEFEKCLEITDRSRTIHALKKAIKFQYWKEKNDRNRLDQMEKRIYTNEMALP